MRLADILKPLDTATFTLRGVPMALRAITAQQALELERQDPEPILTKDNIGTEQYALDVKLYTARRKAQVFGLSAGLVNAKGEEWTPQRDRRWVQAWAHEILDPVSGLTEYELHEAWRAVSRIGVPEESNKTQKRIGSAEAPGN